MVFIVYDLEATCWETPSHGQVQEIIEIGALRMNDFAEVESSFNRFVRPKVHPVLSSYCTRLTSISQIDINRAATFPTVIEEFKDWIGYYEDDDYLLCSWGFFDQRALEADCRLHELEHEWTRSHISVKHQYKELKRIHENIGLKKAVHNEGMEFTGTPHRGIDDARNLAKIFAKYIDVWRY